MLSERVAHDSNIWTELEWPWCWLGLWLGDIFRSGFGCSCCACLDSGSRVSLCSDSAVCVSISVSSGLCGFGGVCWCSCLRRLTRRKTHFDSRRMECRKHAAPSVNKDEHWRLMVLFVRRTTRVLGTRRNRGVTHNAIDAVDATEAVRDGRTLCESCPPLSHTTYNC